MLYGLLDQFFSDFNSSIYTNLFSSVNRLLIYFDKSDVFLDRYLLSRRKVRKSINVIKKIKRINVSIHKDRRGLPLTKANHDSKSMPISYFNKFDFKKNVRFKSSFGDCCRLLLVYFHFIIIYFYLVKLNNYLIMNTLRWLILFLLLINKS